MPTHGVTYEILIASPSDVVAERDIISDCARDWNSAHARSGMQVRDVRWELDAVPAMADRPQCVINEQLVDQADILIGVFKARVGTPTGMATSGTIEEIDRFIAAGKPVMLYFSTGPIPHNHDPEQFGLLQSYKKLVSGRGVYAEFVDENELRRKINHNIAAMMAQLSEQPLQPPPQPDFARIFIRTRPGERSGDVNTVRITGVIENISSVKRITSYVCTVSVPRAVLTHTSAIFNGEVRQEKPTDRRIFRRSESDPGAERMIFAGDQLTIFAIDIAVDQLMKGTYLAGDYTGTMADKVTMDVVIEGQSLHTERTVADIFTNPVQG